MRVLAFVLVTSYLGIAPVYAQSPRSGVNGVVRDSLGHPIRDVNVVVDGVHITRMSDDSGRFDIRGLPQGQNGLTLLKVGFAPLSFSVTLPPDSVVVLAITMHRVQVLSAVNVDAQRVNASLSRLGFFDRQRVGLGTYLTPAHIDSIADRSLSVSHLLRDVRGIELKCGTIVCVPVSRGRANCLTLFVDGAPYGSANSIDSLGFSPASIAAIEVYDRASSVPLEFQSAPPQKVGRGMSMIAGCGSIVLWTKAHVH